MTPRQWLSDEERLNLGPPLAWAIGAAAIASVFAVVVIIVSYAPLNRRSEQRVAADLPPSSYGAVGGLIKATGNACVRICSVSATSSLSASTVLDVACASPDAANGCRAPVRYRVSVEAATGPQR